MLDDADAQHDDGDTSPATATQRHHGLQVTYPPQFEQGHAQGGQEYYQHQHQHQQQQQQQQQYGPTSQQQQRQQMMAAGGGQQAQQAGASNGSFPMGQPIDPNDPNLDLDPFGLSASMHYPTAYSALDQPHR